MDYYKKKKFKNFLLLLVFLCGIYLQFLGHNIASYRGLLIQFLSLGLLILTLYLYNKRYKA